MWFSYARCSSSPGVDVSSWKDHTKSYSPVVQRASIVRSDVITKLHADTYPLVEPVIDPCPDVPGVQANVGPKQPRVSSRHKRRQGLPPGFDELSADEKLEYVQALWEHVAERPEEVPVPDWHREVVAERLAAHRRGEMTARPWREVRDELLARLRAAR